MGVKSLKMHKLSIRSLFLFIFSVTVIGCGEAPEDKKTDDSLLKNTRSLYGEKNFKFPVLSTTAREQVSQWIVYDDFEAEAKAINNSSLQSLKNRTERLMVHTDSLSKKIPDTLKTKIITSRLMVVDTRVNLLLQELNRQRVDSVIVQDYIGELNTSISNLLFQLNEKFQKDAIDMAKFETEEKALEKQKRIRDSIFKEELKDKTNGQQ